MERSGHRLPVGNEGQQGGSSNVQTARLSREAVSRRAAALLLNFYGPLKESRNSDARRHRALQHRVNEIDRGGGLGGRRDRDACCDAGTPPPSPVVWRVAVAGGRFCGCCGGPEEERL